MGNDKPNNPNPNPGFPSKKTRKKSGKKRINNPPKAKQPKGK